MKHSILIVIIASLILSCNHSMTKDNSTLNDSIIPFKGLWVNENYIKTIKTTKSPILGQSEVYESYIYIPSKLHQRTVMIYNFHDGGADLTIQRLDSSYWFYSLDLKDKYDKVMLNNNKLIINNIPFVRIADSTSKGILETILFQGLYQLNDRQIEFTDEGLIKGWDKFDSYLPIHDYFGPALNVDQIILKKGKNKVEKGFKFINDSLYIYDLKYELYDSVNQQYDSVAFKEILYGLKKIN